MKKNIKNNKNNIVNNANTWHDTGVNKQYKGWFKTTLAPQIEHIEVVSKSEIPIEVNLLLTNNFAVKKSVINPNQWKCVCPQCLNQELIVNQNHEWKCTSCSASGKGVADLQEIIQFRIEYEAMSKKTSKSITIAELKNQNHFIELPISGGTGNSIDNPVVIEKPNLQTDYLDIESDYLTAASKCRGKSWRKINHQLLSHNYKSIHKVWIYTIENRETDYLIQREVFYFDLSAYFPNIERRRKAADITRGIK